MSASQVTVMGAIIMSELKFMQRRNRWGVAWLGIAFLGLVLGYVS